MRHAWHIRRGMGNLPHCGRHPGTPLLLFFLGLGVVAAGATGLVVMLCFAGPLYLFGCHQRSVDDLAYEERARPRPDDR
jgi:hypothetical protein